MLTDLGFTHSFDVTGKKSIASLYPKTESRCGIYHLEFSDDSHYFGKAIDNVRRFNDHRKRYDDIVGYSFFPVDYFDLSRVEEETIRKAKEMGLLITNRTFIPDSIEKPNFNLLLSPEDQEAWLKNPALFHDGPRREFKDVDAEIAKYRHKFASLTQMPGYDQLVSITGKYISRTIPAFYRTECSHWGLSCLPDTNYSFGPRFTCLNIYLVEAFVLGHKVKQTESMWGFVNVTKSIFRSEYRSDFSFKQKYPRSDIYYPEYKTVGSDLISIHVNDWETMSRVLDDETVLSAARNLNMMLMRKGANQSSRFHCKQLADRIFESI